MNIYSKSAIRHIRIIKRKMETKKQKLETKSIQDKTCQNGGNKQTPVTYR